LRTVLNADHKSKGLTQPFGDSFLGQDLPPDELADDDEFYRLEALRLEAEKSARWTGEETSSMDIARTAQAAPLLSPVIEDEAPLPEATTPIPIPLRNKTQQFPAFMSRSALFRAGRANGTPLAATIDVPAQGCQIRLSGPRLSMRDKCVWEIALQLAKEASGDMALPYEVSLRDFARRLGESDFGGANLESIWQSLRRLCLARVEFSIPSQVSGVGSLLSTAVKRDGRCHLRLNPDFALPALAGDKQFRIRSERRNALASVLAQWLHDFFSTHSATRDIDFGYLRSLCGYDGPKRNFPARLRSAMSELVQLAPELMAGFEIQNVGRDSDGWKLKVLRGPEQPEFTMPRPNEAERKRRGGVVL
jgi:hypothetical protein